MKVCLKLEPGLRRGESRDRCQIQDQDTATPTMDFYGLWATNFPLGLISTGVKYMLLATQNGLTNSFPTVQSELPTLGPAAVFPSLHSQLLPDILFISYPPTRGHHPQEAVPESLVCQLHVQGPYVSYRRVNTSQQLGSLTVNTPKTDRGGISMSSALQDQVQDQRNTRQ